MNRWLTAAPLAQVVFNPLGCMVSLNDLADRPPLAMTEDETLDVGGHRIRVIPTPHVPHGWEAQVLHDETTRRATVRRGSSPNSSPRRREGHPHAWEVNGSKLRPGDDGVSARDSR
jgi:hypothetical protein